MICVGGCNDWLFNLRKDFSKQIQTIITSPPYWGLRDYGVEGQIGLAPTPEEYVQTMVEVIH